MKIHTAQDYKVAASFHLWMAQRDRLYQTGSTAHLEMADLYVKSALSTHKKERGQ